METIISVMAMIIITRACVFCFVNYLDQYLYKMYCLATVSGNNRHLLMDLYCQTQFP
jgi:hypothetical protein